MSRAAPFVGFLGYALIVAGPLHAQTQPAPAAKTAAKSVRAATANADQAPDTLMFTIDELNDIQSYSAKAERAANDGQGGQNPESIENASLFLSTIVYSGPNDWTIWVNGVPIGPNQDFQAFKVTDIGSNFVELLVPLSAQGMRPVRLSPNQTFVAKSGAIVEGQWLR